MSQGAKKLTTSPRRLCNQCNAPIHEGKAFCVECGAKQENRGKRLCKKCGIEFPADASFCPKCGLVEEITIRVPPSPEIKQLDLATKELAASIGQLTETIRRITQQKMAQRTPTSPPKINVVAPSGSRQMATQQIPPSAKIENVNLQVCSECHQSYPLSKVIKCYECGRIICQKCAPSTFSLGVCPPCEEVFEGEEDYYNWA